MAAQDCSAHAGSVRAFGAYFPYPLGASFAQQKEELTATTQYRLDKGGHKRGDLVPPRFILFRLFGQGWKLLTSYGGRGV